MEFKINCSPNLKMDEITKKLFNCDFLSDIQFSVGDKIIYAHSLELMKRSVVFEHQLLENIGEKKLIPITDCSYESFLEFVRFIYTDNCEINDDNGIELLKLSAKYKIIMLENRVIRSLSDKCLKLFEHCVIEKYEIARNICYAHLVLDYGLFKNEQFSLLHQHVVNEVLQFDQIGEGVTEFDIFKALAGWIDNYCKQHGISLTQGRERFDHLIKKIRFPTMANDEISECFKIYPGLLNDSDFMSFATQLLRGGDGNNLWISKRRSVIKSFYYYCNNSYYQNNQFRTALSVSKDTILYGLCVGIERGRSEIQIIISDGNGNYVKLKERPSSHFDTMLISLGDSIVLKPNFHYTIAVTHLNVRNKYACVIFREEFTDLKLIDPENSIQNINASGNIIEMYFKPPL